MKKRIFILVAIMAMVFLFTPMAMAFKFKSGNNITVSKNELIDEDLYISGGNLSIDAPVKGDLVAAGGQITVNGDVEGDIIAAGGMMRLNGNVTESERIAGGMITVNGHIKKDIFVFGGNIEIAKNCQVDGDLVVSGGNLVCNGNIGRSIIASAGTIIIGGTVEKDVNIDSTGSLTIGSGAVIKGNLKYASPQRADIKPDAKIKGTTTYQKTIIEKPAPEKKATVADFFYSIFISIIWLCAMIILGIIFILIAPKRTVETAEMILKRPWASLGLGFLMLIVVPIASIILICTVIGIPLGLIGLMIYIVALYISKIFVSLMIGKKFLAWIKKREDVSLIWSFIIGLIIVSILIAIPYLGTLVSLACIVFGLGAIYLSLVNTYKEIKQNNLI